MKHYVYRNSKWLVDNHIKAFYSLTRHPEFSEGARSVIKDPYDAFTVTKNRQLLQMLYF